MLGPASALLEAELKRIVKERGLVIWLDAEDNYSRYVAGLERRAQRGEFPYPVVHFGGSFLELMLALEPHGNDLHPDKVLVHVPGFNSQSIAETPLYELFKAGKRYDKALDTLIREACSGLVFPEESQRFRESKPTLEAADAWLLQAKSGEQDVFLIGLRERSLTSLVSEVFQRDSKLNADLAEEAHRAQLCTHLEKELGLPGKDWALFLRVTNPPRLEDVEFFLGSWLMAVEFVTDLQEPPVTPELVKIGKLDKLFVKTCRKLVGQLREYHPAPYRGHALYFEEMLRAEQGHRAESLGSIDTFQFEERTVRRGALLALAAGDWGLALNYANQRHPEACFWVRQDRKLERNWDLTRAAAEVGKALAAHDKGLRGCASLEEAATRYGDALFAVDQKHRLFEQRYHRDKQDVEDEETLTDARDAVRKKYRQWADRITAEFAKLCEDVGPLPAPDQRQRAVYEQFVHPIIERGERVAFFMVDAMRFEIAEQLCAVFKEKKYKTTLSARLAELPTVTEVGMNALAPVSQAGRLRAVVKDRKFLGFRTGEKFTVDDPETRVRAMASRSVGGNAIDMTLSELTELSKEALKKKLKTKGASPLIVVRSLELDNAGEKGFHLSTFEHTLVQLREAVQRLHGAGVGWFVLTADHGFLLQDQTTQTVHYKDGPKRRHVFSPQPSGMADALEIPLSALDYETEQPGYLVFRRDTAMWSVPNADAQFAHGGNSLQERVIPVLTLEKRGGVGGTATQYEVVASALPAEAGRQRLSLQLRLQKQSSGLLSFAGPKRVSLALRVPGMDVTLQVVDVSPPGTLENGTLLVPPGAEAATVTFTIEGVLDDQVQKLRVEVYHPDGTENVKEQVVKGWFEPRPARRGKGTTLPPGADVGGSLPPGSEAATSEELAFEEPGSEELGSQTSRLQTSKSDAPRSAEFASPTNAQNAAALDWRDEFEDKEFAQVFVLIEAQESVNEEELQQFLKNPRRVRAFARSFDTLKGLVPFDVQIITVSGMKSYVKGDMR